MDKAHSHKDVNDANGYKNKLLDTVDSPEGEDQTDGEEDSESNSLLPPKKSEMSRKSDKTPRKVQWNDKNGNNLVEIVEFEPSDVSDSEDEDSDSCVCTIM
ncbi:hypothetical protein SLE2022_251400 [Rubroshorea leprosula]